MASKEQANAGKMRKLFLKGNFFRIRRFFRLFRMFGAYATDIQE
jgi:hypothetical protein